MLRSLLIHVVLVLLAALAACAQTGADRIQGTVKDATDAVIPDAGIVAEQMETGTRFTTTSLCMERTLCLCR